MIRRPAFRQATLSSKSPRKQRPEEVQNERQRKNAPSLEDRAVGFQRLARLAPEVGLEPTTHRLTADCSTIELLWNPNGGQSTNRRRYRQQVFSALKHAGSADNKTCFEPPARCV